MASTSIQKASSSLLPCYSSSLTGRSKYDVFLSFRGEDTRCNFTGYLYYALARRGIVVFMDDRELKRGKCISKELLKAIQESSISIIVFSENYAFSTWCLNELVKIVECKNERGQTILPIFYHVDPSEVRKQTGKFQQAFVEHEQVFRNEVDKVQKWRDALTEVANLAGWNLQHQSEPELVETIAEEIFAKLFPPSSRATEGLDGIGARLQKLLMGMGSMFKHLLSEALTERSSTFSNEEMIQRRARNKKILLVLDEVDDQGRVHQDAVKNLDWFGTRSEVIITSRKKYWLGKTHGMKEKEMLHYDFTIVLKLPSLTGPCTLWKLDLRNCNLSEDAIPNDLSQFCSLRWLDLSANNFVSLPSSILNLRKLKYLVLENCRRLKSLPELPSSLKTLSVSNCTSLETLSITPRAHPDLELGVDGLNCLRLVGHDGCKMVVSIMIKYLGALCPLGKELPIASNSFEMVVPGSEITSWFKNQSPGNSVLVPFAPHLLHEDGFMGFAVCVIFSQTVQHQFCSDRSIRCYIEACGMCLPPFLVEKKSVMDPIESDHIWVFHLCRPKLLRAMNKWQSRSNEMIRILFKNPDEDFEIKRCGVRVLYEQDVLEWFDYTTSSDKIHARFKRGHDDHDEEQQHQGKRLKSLSSPTHHGHA